MHCIYCYHWTIAGIVVLLAVVVVSAQTSSLQYDYPPIVDTITTKLRDEESIHDSTSHEIDDHNSAHRRLNNPDSLLSMRSHSSEGPPIIQNHDVSRSFKMTRNKNKSLRINVNANKKANKELMAIVHIGPHKTATTTIQALTAIVHDDIVQDGYEMPWALVAHDLRHVNAEPYVDINQYNFVSCMHVPDVKMFPEAKCNPQLIKATEQIATEREQNVILSSEEFSRTNIVRIDHIYDTLANYYQRIRIVVFYRRFYDWLFSYWHQFAKYRKASLRKSFPEYVNNLNIVQELHDTTYTIGCMKRYQQYFSDVVVYNMHDMGSHHDVSEMFFCDAVPNATNACEKVKQRNLKPNKRVEINSFHPLVYEELAYHAEYTYQLYDSNQLNVTLSEVTSLTRQRHERELNLTQYDFHSDYVVCPSDDALQFLLQTTLHDEKVLFPPFYESDKGEPMIRQQFAKDSKTKLCFIDTKKILENDYNQWQQFFMSLKKQRR